MGGNGIGRNYMKDKVFFDSNIFVYYADQRYPEKMNIAQNLINSVFREGNGVISTQNLQEFYNASTKKLHRDKSEVRRNVEDFAEIFPVVQINVPLITKAVDLQVRYQLSFYDALIIATASKENCVICYSEDLSNGQIYDGVKIVNPF